MVTELRSSGQRRSYLNKAIGLTALAAGTTAASWLLASTAGKTQPVIGSRSPLMRRNTTGTLGALPIIDTPKRLPVHQSGLQSVPGLPPLLQAGALSIYVADIPAAYTTGVTGRGKIETDIQYGYDSLGQLLSPQEDHWDTIWHQVDAWFINQLKMSRLRTYDADAADIVFVPAMLSINSEEQQTGFVRNAYDFLPQLGKKPHLVVLNHAPKTYNSLSALLTHENSRLFTFVSWGVIDPPLPPHKTSHIVGAPAFSHVHWSLGSRQLSSQGRQFNVSEVLQSKTILSVGSFAVRHYADRVAVHTACIQQPANCKHLDFTGPKDAVPVFAAYRSAWYALHPQGDFLSRNSWFDTFMAGTIPVVFQAEYVNAVPFTDLIDYRDIMEYIPEATILGDGGENVVSLLANRFNQDEALNKTRTIHRIRQIFQYMLNPAHEVIRWPERAMLHSDDDAFTFTMKSVMRNVCARGWLADRCQTSPPMTNVSSSEAPQMAT